MRVTYELNDLWDVNFQGWSGGHDRLKNWRANYPDFVDYLSEYIEDCFPDGLTETELNDLILFDGDDLFAEWKAENGIDEEEDEEEE